MYYLGIVGRSKGAVFGCDIRLVRFIFGQENTQFRSNLHVFLNDGFVLFRFYLGIFGGSKGPVFV